MSALSNFLGQVFGAPYRLKDPAHAARLYVDDYYRLTPKIGFMYYVIFNINPNGNEIIQNFKQANGREIGLLVKTADLPKFKMQTETLNQYNRKTVVQSRIDYQPISLTFHDDNNNTSIALWEAYYRYYFADAKEDTNLSRRPAKYSDTKYNKTSSIVESFNYGLNNDQKAGFFDSIEIYQLARKQFTAFKILNPIITDWSHDQVDQSQSKLLENKMTVAYETVQYATGEVKKDSPAGFASIHYDQRPSPIAVNGSNTLFGSGGILDTAGALFGNVGNTSPLGLFGTAQKAGTLVRNLKNVTKSSLKSEGYSILTGALGKLGQPENSRVAYQLGVSKNNASTPAGIGTLGVNTLKGLNSSVGGLVTAGLSKLTGKNSGVAAPATRGLAVLGSGLGLPSKLPSSGPELEALKAEQEAEIARVTAELREAERLEAEYNERIEALKAAGDDQGLQDLYNEMESEGYTDPAELEQYLAGLEDQVDQIDVSIAEVEELSDEEAQSLFDEQSEYDDLDTGEMNDFDFPGYEEELTEDENANYYDQENEDIEDVEWPEYDEEPPGDD